MSWLSKRVHASWSIGWGFLGIVIGAGIQTKINALYFADPTWWILITTLIFLTFVKLQVWSVVFIFVAGCLLGLSRGSHNQIDQQKFKPYYGHVISIKGLVAQDTSYGPKGDQRAILNSIEINRENIPGDVWISISKNDVKRGDIITVKGTLSEGFGNTSASLYRAQILSIIRPYPGDVARRVRDWFGESARKSIPEPQVSLGLGYLLGQKTALPKTLEEQIKTVGLTHAVVASGYNLTILVIFCRKLFMRVSKFVATGSSTVLIICFMLITGLSPSMTRAGLVACLGLLVWYYGRKMHPFVLLSFASGMTILFNPSYVNGDLGWYLSFGSFIGVIVLAPLLQHYFWGISHEVPMLRQLIIDTLSAQILTWPIILHAFGLFTTFSLLANVLVLPFVPFAMLATFISGLAGLILPGIAGIVSLPAVLVLKYSTEVISRVASLPDSQKEISFNTTLMLASYIVIGVLIFYLIRRTNHDFRADPEPKSF